MAAASTLAGEDIGTPIIASTTARASGAATSDPSSPGYLSTEDSLALWDALSSIVNIDGFWELKRTRTERPDYGDRP